MNLYCLNVCSIRGKVASLFKMKLPTVRGYFIHELFFNFGAVKCSISTCIIYLITSREKILRVRKTGSMRGEPVKPKTLISEWSLLRNQSPTNFGFNTSLRSFEIMITLGLKTLNMLRMSFSKN